MKWTPERVRLHLGLQPWHEFLVLRDQYFEGIRNLFSIECWNGVLKKGRCLPRQTGRTTYLLLLNVVAHAGNGERVQVVGSSDWYTCKLVYRAKEMAAACGIDPSRVSRPRRLRSQPKDLVGRHEEREPLRFEDHSVWEKELERLRRSWRREWKEAFPSEA
jgi:hypothetical protein